MAFPSSPSNNQTAIVNGITHAYDSSKNAWVRQQTSISASGSDDLARTIANTATNNITIIQGVDTTQNTRMSVIEGGLISANANTVYLNTLITTNNTRISVIEGGLITANANTLMLQGVNTSQNTRISVLEGGLISANANTIFLNSLITTNNTRIDSANNTARAAYDKANAAFDKANTGGSGGSVSASGYLANSVIIANTTGYLSNSSSIQYFTSNNNLVLTGNVIAGGVRNTSSNTAPSSPTVGDIWYKISNDTIYRYTYDGTSNYWVDITTPTTSTSGSGTAYTRNSFTATSGQTTFVVTYTVNFIQVYVNGVLLNASDYTATSGTNIVLAVACTTGDIVETIAFNINSVTTTTSTASNAYADSNTVIFINNNVISANANIAANKGAMSVGPVYYAAGVTVNMAANSRWVIL